MSMKIKLHPEVEKFLKANGSSVTGSKEWYLLPYWFEKDRHSEEYTVLHFDELPEELKSAIKLARDNDLKLYR